MTETYYSHGKLLISGEYAVLHGALALALPLRYGQRMDIAGSKNQNFTWKAMHPGGLWFKAVFDRHLNLVTASHEERAGKLRKILSVALQMAGKTSHYLSGINIMTTLEFNPDWGWGSSSTLIQNLAAWLKIDPFALLQETFGGSGYDVAAAASETPILYRLNRSKKPVIEPVNFSPPFKQQMGVVYLNRKQSSEQAVMRFSGEAAFTGALLEEISQISLRMCKTSSREEFTSLMQTHEKLISEATGLPSIQKQHFPDFEGAVKSMGAWGGDFALWLSDKKKQEIMKYFQTKEHPTVFSLCEIILNK